MFCAPSIDPLENSSEVLTSISWTSSSIKTLNCLFSNNCIWDWLSTHAINKISKANFLIRLISVLNKLKFMKINKRSQPKK